MQTNNLISFREAAKRLDVSPMTLRYWCKTGKLAPVDLEEGIKRFNPDDLDAFINEQSKIKHEVKRILVIDDDKQMVSLIEDILKKWAECNSITLEISSSLSAAQAEAELNKGAPDLIVLDLMLPLVSGYQICHDIKAKQSNASKIIAITGYHNSSNESHILSLGADTCLAKPIDSQSFLDTVSELLEVI